MGVEIEKKYRLSKETFDEMTGKLKTAGANFVRDDFEENVIYGGPALAGSGGVLRIRKTADRSLITFKRRLPTDSGAKHQTEFETEIADAEVMENIVRELGLAPRLVYEKRRRIWLLRDAEVVLDELPFGFYMEIEGSINAIREAELLLELGGLAAEDRTYPMLTAELGRASDEGITEARFN